MAKSEEDLKSLLTKVRELDMEQQTGSKLGKEYVKAVYCHPAYLNYMQGTSCEMLQAGKGSVQFSSVAQSCPTLCDPMNRSTPGLPVHHQLPEFTQTHVHQVSDAIQPVHSEGDQPWDFFGRNDGKAETPILWPPHVKG